MHVAFDSHFGGFRSNDGLQTSAASKVLSGGWFEISNLNNLLFYRHDASNSHFCGVWGHSNLQMTSEVTCDVIFEISSLNNLCCHALLTPTCNIDKISGQKFNAIPPWFDNHNPLTSTALLGSKKYTVQLKYFLGLVARKNYFIRCKRAHVILGLYTLRLWKNSCVKRHFPQ